MKLLLAVLPALAMLGACDECAGTPSCRTQPEIGYSAQFVDRRTGAPVAGVDVAFVRRGGIEIIGDTIRARTNGDGFFVLRAGSVYNGSVTGDLLVTPPAAWPSFTIPGITLRTSQVRGNGDVGGRFVVNPYILLVAHIRDRTTLAPLVGATVTVRRVAGGRVAEEEQTFTTDHGGQFSWEPAVVEPGTVDAEFTVTASGYPRAFSVRRSIPLQFRDGEFAFVIVPVGYGLSYAATTSRRGSGEVMPGARVEFSRVNGVATQPEQAEMTPDIAGRFVLPVAPLAEGALTARLRIVPPAPIRPETVTVVLQTHDDDLPIFLGDFQYGSQVFMTAELRDAATGERLPAGTGVTMKRTGGVQLAWSNPLPDGDLLGVSDTGFVAYKAPTADSGTVTYDMIVRHPAPFAPDTIRGLSVPSSYSDRAVHAGVIQVRRRLAP